MPSRRSLLAATGATGAAAPAVAGCSTPRGPAGSPAGVRRGRDLLPADGEPIADATADRTGCPRGDVRFGNTGNTEPGERRVRRSGRGGGLGTCRFRPTYTFGDAAGTVGSPADEDDEVAEITAEVPLSTAGLSPGRSETVTQEAAPVYGRADP